MKTSRVSTGEGLRIVLCVLVLLSCIFSSPVSFAQQRSWRISDFSADIEVHQDGSADVDERITDIREQLIIEIATR